MATVRRLESRKLPSLNQALSTAGITNGLTNVFNPSIAAYGQTRVVSFRALPEDGRKPFRAYLLTLDGSNAGEVIDLTHHAAEFGIGPVADPKTFAVDGKLFVTFNTGHPADRSRPNELYVMSVAPVLGAPQRCDLPESSRQRVEKNWAFFQDDSGLAGFYSIAPLRALRLVDGDLDVTDRPLTFAVANESQQHGQKPPALSMGTQPVRIGNRLLLVAHEKLQPYRKRAYFGRLVEVTTNGGSDAMSRVSRVRLIHSYRDALPQRNTHNKYLLSATYFSGIVASPTGRLVLSYGINDRAFNFAEVEESDLW